MINRKICVVTDSRAEYGLFYPILVKIKESPKLDLQLITTSSHHSSEFGDTYKLIEDDVLDSALRKSPKTKSGDK